MRTLHTCKQVMLYAVIFVAMLTVSKLVYSRSKNTSYRTSNRSTLTVEQQEKLLSSLGTRSVREDVSAKAPRPNAPTFPTIVNSSPDSATLKLMQENICDIKRCLQQLKGAFTFDFDSTSWQDLINKIDCQAVINPDTPTNLAEGQEQLAEGVAEILCRIGCLDDIAPDPEAVLDANATTTFTVIQWLKAIYYKVK